MKFALRSGGWLLLSSALVSACQFVGATDNNLRELHNEDGLHRRTAKVVSHYSYATNVAVAGALSRLGAKTQTFEAQSIKDPLSTCLEALEELASYNSRDPWERALQIEHFSRLARFDPWVLSRERAVLELGRVAAVLGPWTELPQPLGATPATSEQSVPAIQALLRAAGQTARGAEGVAEPAGAQPLSLASACAALGALDLPLEASYRALRVCALLQRSRLGAKDLEPVLALRAQLERRCVSLALLGALADESPEAGERMGSDPGWNKAVVQAAAVTSCVRVWGAPMLEKLLRECDPRRDAPERLTALMEGVKRLGLAPTALPAPADAAFDARRLVWQLAVDHPDGVVRVAALDALGRVTGRGRFSLRSEDWLDWAREAGYVRPTYVPPTDEDVDP